MQRNQNDLIKALGLESLSEKDREEILAKVDKRLEQVLIGVLVANITDEDAMRIHNALKEDKDLEEVVAEISARIPGLAAKIEGAVEDEIGRMRAFFKS